MITYNARAKRQNLKLCTYTDHGYGQSVRPWMARHKTKKNWVRTRACECFLLLVFKDEVSVLLYCLSDKRKKAFVPEAGPEANDELTDSGSH